MVNNVMDTLSNEVQMVSSAISWEDFELRNDGEKGHSYSYYSGHGLNDLQGLRKSPGFHCA